MANDTVRLRVRWRQSGQVQSVKKRLTMSLKQLSGMSYHQFQEFVGAQVGLRTPLTLAYIDDDGDRVPVTTDDELNVLAYVAELTSRRGRELDIRVRDQPAKSSRGSRTSSSASASHSSSRHSSKTPAPAPEDPVRSELWKRVDEWYSQTRASARHQKATPTPGTARRQQATPADGGGDRSSAGATPRHREPAAAQKAATPRTGEQERATAKKSGQETTPRSSGQETAAKADSGEEAMRPRNISQEAKTPRNSGQEATTPSSRDQESTATLVNEHPSSGQRGAEGREKATAVDGAAGGTVRLQEEPPGWFAPFMIQFQRDMLSEVAFSIKSEMQQLMLASSCTCACGSAPAGDTSGASGSSADRRETGVQTSAPPPAPRETAAPRPAPTLTGTAAALPPEARRNLPPVTIPAPPQPAITPPASPPRPAAASPVKTPPAPSSPPIDRFGLFSVPEFSGCSVGGVFIGKTVYDSSRGSSVSSAGGGSVTFSSGDSVPTYTDGGGTVVTGSGGESVVSSTGGSWVDVRGSISSSQRTPATPPRRSSSASDDIEEEDYRCMLVMTERTGLELPQPRSPPPLQQQSPPLPQKSPAVQQHSPPVQQQDTDTEQEQPQQSPVHQQQQPSHDQTLTPDNDDDDYVTVNGRRLSLSEDDFSDIVIISSPDGSERFEMVNPQLEMEGEAAASDGVDVMANSDVGTMLASALSERWADADLSLGCSSHSSEETTSWLSQPCEAIPSNTQSAPDADHIEILGPAPAISQETVSLPEGEASPPWDSVSLEEPLSSLPRQLRGRLLEQLQRLPERRQRALAAQLTGRRSLEGFWQRLSAAAEVTGRTLLEELLLDQAERPGGVGLLMDALLAQVLAVKQSGASGAGSALADAEGVQALKHALFLLRSAVPEQELADHPVPVPEPEPELSGCGPEPELELSGCSQPPQQESAAQPQPPQQGSAAQPQTPQPRQPEESAAADARPQQLVEPDAAPLPYAETAVLRPVSPQPEASAPPPQEQEQGGVTERLAALLPVWARNALLRVGVEAPPSEAETETIALLVDMGFTNLERIRQLYRQLDGDCAEIVSRLLEGADD